MIEFWLDRTKCTGCAACANACPADALSMEDDELGFSYPRVLPACIECGRCVATCRQRQEELSDTPTGGFGAFAAWTTQEDLRFHSTSGGLFTELSRVVLRSGGVVFGARYGQNNEIEHASAETEEQLEALRQSKYAQSTMNQTMREVRKALRAKRSVLFCGTPCQVAGLKAYLGTPSESLLLVDFICRGVNSPKAYRAWLHEIEEERGQLATRVWFKYKEGGWKSSPRRTRIDFEDGSNLVLSGDNNLFMTGYLKPNLYLRPSCSSCEFKGSRRASDITLADYWGADSEIDDDKGTSLVLVNTARGLEALRALEKWVNLVERPLEEAIRNNASFGSPVHVHEHSADFLADLDTMSFSEALHRYYHPSMIQQKLKGMYKRGTKALSSLFPQRSHKR